MGTFNSDGVLLSRVMRNHIDTWTDKPSKVFFEAFDKKTVPAIMLQQLSAAEVKKSYINGSYIGQWVFAIYARTNAEDTKSRFDAVECLQKLGDWLQAKNDNGTYAHLPEIDDKRSAIKIEMTSTPAIASRYEDGCEDYQAIFTLDYKATRR